MSAENSLSLSFYQYLCQKIGSEKEVKARRLTHIIHDIESQNSPINKITSGSIGEGLQLKGSDIDYMYIDYIFKVYESERDVVPQSSRCIPLVMHTEDTHPCFTKLHVVNNHDFTVNHRGDITKICIGRHISSELYRLAFIENMARKLGEEKSKSLVKVHGPCISNLMETLDFASCLKCDKWISQAQQWIIRPRTTWPPPDLISKIISCGVHYVPIGYKGSRNENLQWRISFSVAEKFLIFSFNHTQLLCYALLKITIKEIVEKHDDLKNLLCSYFLKTLMFWISEEADPSMWKPEKIIPCFMACLKRLIYCVEYSTLLHYFIPENNLFYLRFEIEKNEKNNKFEENNKKAKLIRILKNLFAKGIYCFARSDTLFDIRTLSLITTNSELSEFVAIMQKIINDLSRNHRPINLLYHLLHHSRTKISKCLFLKLFSLSHQDALQGSQDKTRSNKQKYHKNKLDLSHLLIGTNSDAVGGWLMLASFLYVQKNYLLSLDIINYALRKCPNETIYPWQNGLNQNQENLMCLLNQEELSKFSKAFTVRYPEFIYNSPIFPLELQLNISKQSFHFHPMIFAHFLIFLCNYHLPEIRSCRPSLTLLHKTCLQYITSYQCNQFSVSILLMCIGTCYQMIGETNTARKYFQLAVLLDEHNLTSAAMKLSNCNVY